MEYFKYPPEIASAWKILLDCGVDRLPVPVISVARKIGIPVLPYSRADKQLKLLGVYDIAMDADGVSCHLKEGHIIYYDDTLIAERRRIAIGHELGHVILGHVPLGATTLYNRPAYWCKNRKEYAANLFCEQLVAPTCVLLEKGAANHVKIEQLCHVTRKASDFITARLNERGPDYRPANADEISVLMRLRDPH